MTTLQNTRLYWLHALTPLHLGVGRGLNYIDLPIMREKVSNWPVVPSSAVKGVLRAYYSERNENYLDAAFGSGGDTDANAGSLTFTDARIVCLPVRSFYGTFAWCTSPMALRRFRRDLDMCGLGKEELGLPKFLENGQSLTPKDTELVSEGYIYLEDLDFQNTISEDIALSWASEIAKGVFSEGGWAEEFIKRFVIVSDEAFNFLCDTGTEVNARIRLEQDTKTVKDKALWYEEALPAETILAGAVWCERLFKGKQANATIDKLFAQYCSNPVFLQVGGKATTGHGQVRCIFDNAGA